MCSRAGYVSFCILSRPSCVAVALTKANIGYSLAVCAIYYAVWIYVLPHYGKYRIRQELVALDDETAKVHRLVKIPLAELDSWDAEHDVLGQKLERSRTSESASENDGHLEEEEAKKDA